MRLYGVFSVGIISAILAVPFLASAATITIGETTVLPSTDSGNGNMLLVQDVVLSQTATVQSLSFNIKSASGNLRLGIYDSTGPNGGPGALKAQTNSFVPLVGWNTQPVIIPVSLPAGNYWLAYFPSSSSLSFATNFSIGQFRLANLTFGSMPATFPAISQSGVTHWSLYATLDTVPPPPDTIAPSVPAGLSATSVTFSQINLSWSVSTDNIGVTGYNIFRNGVQIATSSTNSYANTGLSPNTSYSYAVRAFDAAGNYSALSGSYSTTTPSQPVSDTTPPTGSIVINAGDAVTNNTSVTLTLSATDTQNAVTQMRLSNTGTSFNAAVAYAPTLPWTLTTGAGTKTVYVQFKDAAGNWSGSFTDTIVLDTTAPTITARTATNIAVNAATITWTTNEPATSQVDYGLTTSYGNTTPLDSSLVTAHSVTLTGLNANTTYNYRVRSADAAGNSAQSANSTFKTLTGPDTTPPSTPSGLTATPISSTQINLAWNASTDNVAVTGYNIFRDGINIATTTASPRTFSDTGRTANTAYTYNVRALDAAGNVSALSATTTATTLPPPDTTPPSILISSPVNGAQVSNIITATADATDNVSVAGVQFLVDGVALSVEDTVEPYGVDWDTRLFSNGSHTLTARAHDAAGNNTTSAPITVNVVNANFFQNEILATGLNLPTAIKFLPDGRMLVVELPGTIKVLPPPYTTPDPTPFLDLNLNIQGYAGLQQGIFDLTFDPNFATNHFYYIFYTNNTPNVDRLSRFTANANLTGTAAGSEVILYQDPNIANTEHHGGAVNFGNDGKIYFTTGEHFDGNNAQNLTNPRGKIHRINSDGTVPTDNPFYDGAGPNWDSIWAFGLRNPFRAYYDPPTGKLYVADVGGNDYSTAYEEVDVGVRGANYGWADCEFGTCGNPAFSPALYAYPHLGRDASITGGFVYHGSQFPASYQGSYFFGDYAQNWIKRLTFDANGNVNGVFNFEPANGSADGPYGDIVYLTEGPEGALYYVDLGYSDVGGTFGISKIRRISYHAANQAPTAISSASPTAGTPPLTVNFSSAGSNDPEGNPLTYMWSFGDSATSSAANPTHIYTVGGQYFARVTTSDGVNSTLSTPISISVGTPPAATILAPVANGFFRGGDIISFNGIGTDPDDGTLPPSAYTWDIDFLHAGHVHPGAHITGTTTGTFVIPITGHDFSGNTRYRFTLTVTDSNGLQTSTSTIIFPDKVNLSFDTLPTGVALFLDGIAKATAFVYDTLIGFQHSIEARNASTATTTWTFSSWSDGGAQTHTVTVPTIAQSYMATYSVATTSTPFTMGDTSIYSGFDNGNGNLLLVHDSVLMQSGTLQSLSFYVSTAVGQLRLGLYDATGPAGGPGQLKAQTNAFTPVVGWNTQNVIAPVTLAAGNYWLAYLPQNNSLEFVANRAIGQFKYANFTFGPMPTTFPSIAGSGVTHWSLYGTLTP